MNTCSWITAVDWSNNCSCLSERLQLFGQTTADVLSNIYNSCTKQLQYLQRTSAVDVLNNATKYRCCFIEQLQLLHRTMHRTTAMVSLNSWPNICCNCTGQLQLFHGHISTNNCSWLTSSCSCLGKQLQLFDRATVIIWARNPSCVGDEQQLFGRSIAVVAPNSYSFTSNNWKKTRGFFTEQFFEQLQLIRPNNCSCFIKQLPWFRWTTERTTLVFAPNNCNCFISTFTRITAVGWSNNCSCLAKQLQLFEQTIAVVWPNNCRCFIKHLQ